MTIEIRCPKCDKNYTLRDELAGKSVRCKACGNTFAVRTRRSPRREEPEEEEFEVVEEDYDAPIVRVGRGSRSRSSIKFGGKKSRDHDENSFSILRVLLGVIGTIGFFLVLCCGIGTYFGVNGRPNQIRQGGNGFPQGVPTQAPVVVVPPPANIPAPGPSDALYPLASYPLPTFPELGAGQPINGSSVLVQTIILQPPPDQQSQPAHSMQMRVYVPAGEHAAGSLPLVLVAPAGSPLITGNVLDPPDSHVETLPYAEAGAVVIMYSLDGALANIDSANDFQWNNAYNQFRWAGAGTVNARTALEFALAKIPAVDPNKIVVAGHSSAGTLSMLYAAHEPRLAAAIAYCPCIDVQKRMGAFTAGFRGTQFLIDVDHFLKKSSPLTQAAQIQCPVFLFHSFDDTNCPYAETEQFHSQLTSAGKDATLSQPPAFGDHYQPMIDQGIPRAIVWLRSRQILPAP